MMIYMASQWGDVDIFRQIPNRLKEDRGISFTSNKGQAKDADYMITSQYEDIAEMRRINLRKQR